MQGHKRVGKAVAQADIDRFYGVGTLTAYAIETAARAGLKAAYYFSTKSDLLAALKSDLKEGDTLLVKGSRGSRMEEIIEGLSQ
jgi:UDP-N-acetylmuramoyl-tripeptide--D-alanyl-D-alanine ligase